MSPEIVFGAWLFSGVVFVFVWSLTSEMRKGKKPPPNQWEKYRGVMSLPARKGEPPPIDTAALVRVLKQQREARSLYERYRDGIASEAAWEKKDSDK